MNRPTMAQAGKTMNRPTMALSNTCIKKKHSFINNYAALYKIMLIRWICSVHN